MAIKKNTTTDRGDFDRFTSDGFGLTVSKPDATRRKAVAAYNRRQSAKTQKTKKR